MEARSCFRNEHELYVSGKPCALDQEKVRKLTDLGVKWKKFASESEKSCGKRKLADLSSKLADTANDGDDEGNSSDTIAV